MQAQAMTAEEQLLDAVVIGASRDLSTVAVFLDLRGLEWCVIGGAAVNSHAATALYDDRLDVAVDAGNLVPVLADLAEEGFAAQVDSRAHVAHATRPGDGHRLRVCLHFGPAYRSMPRRAVRRAILGCLRPVASLPDLEQGLLIVRDDPGQGWHARGKAELDLARLVERDQEHALACADGDGWGEPCAA